MTLRTEAQILKNWQQQKTPLVSVICITYNHELYITDAIEGFLKQETDFPLEIVIHDDASIDKTPEIIRYYAKKYPRIIKPIFQKKNQSSQLQKNTLLPIILTTISRTQGNFIAYCDGDDYWIDANKLQIQISEMRKYSNCEVSFHPVSRKCVNGKKRDRIIAMHSSCNKIFRTRQLILGAAGFCPTTSFIFRRSVFERIPQWLFDAPCTDYFLQILGSLQGGALYISKVMAVYRSFSVGSWTERMTQEEKLVCAYFTGMLQALKNINSHTDNQYNKEIDIIMKKLSFYMCINPALSLEKRKEIFIVEKSKFNFKDKLLWLLVFKNRKLSKLILNTKNYLFN